MRGIWLASAIVLYSVRQSGSVSNADVEDVVEKMLEADPHFARNGKVDVDFQQHTSSRSSNDAAPQKLFDRVSSDLLNTDTVKALIAMFDNYNPDVGHTEDNTPAEQREVDRFLAAVLKTDVMKVLETFLKSKGLLSRDSLESLLRSIWFNNYSRAKGRKDTSAFEHVFIGEYKNKEVSGMHNWIRLNFLEQQGHVDYKGFIMKRNTNHGRDPRFALIRYTWQAVSKPSGSFMFGTSPEFDMAVYSLCYLVRDGKSCQFYLDGLPVEIVTHTNVQGGRKYLGSAYPSIPRKR